MRRAAVALVAACFVLSGCSSGSEPTPRPFVGKHDNGPKKTHRDPKPANVFAPPIDPVALDCYPGDAHKVQVIYAVASDRADRYGTQQAAVKGYAAAVDGIVSASAAQSGGVRHIRYVTDPDCTPNVVHLVMQATGDDTWNTMRDALVAAGYNRTDRRYLVYVDASVGICGLSNEYADSRPDPLVNQNATGGGVYSRIDAQCWGGFTEAHELAHALGANQLDSPHKTSKYHCTDEYDNLCYADGTGAALTYPCAQANDYRWDCGHDDYFNAGAVPAGSYLATHWNLADSPYLAATGTTVSPTPTPTTASPTTASPTPAPAYTCGKRHRRLCQ